MYRVKSRDKIIDRRFVILLNSIINVFWSIITLFPATVFCYRYVSLKLFAIIIVVSFFPVFLPVSFLNNIQVFKKRLTYKKVGVEFISRFTQNGAFVNNIIKKRYPGYKVVLSTKQSRVNLLRQTYMFEKFHLLLFVFFTVLIFYALIHQYYWWALVLLLSNIIYNVYPCLLQQYTRLRLLAFKKSSM